MPQVSPGQLHLLFVSIALFAIGGGLSLSRLGAGNDRRRLGAKACLYGGLLVGLLTLVWHSAGRGSWVPMEDNFDALVWLGLLMALFVLYAQRPFANAHPLRGLDGFIVPIVVVLLTAAAVFGRAKPHEYLGTTWSWAHRASSYAGAGALGVACAVGGMFLIVQGRLRRKTIVVGGGGGGGPRLGSLEQLERLMLASVLLGFALITIGAVTGLAKVAQAHQAGHGTRLGRHWFFNPKVVLSTGVWLVYAVVLHSPMNPAVRGRRAAVLSVVGFVLMVGTLVAVQFMPR